MKIEIVYIACYRYDVRLTRALVASIRYWYPDLPIELVKDEYYGPYDTSEIETAWNVSIFPSERRIFGWGFGKLEPLFQPVKKRCLILDSDIVLSGTVLEQLEAYDEDFVVTHEEPPNQRFIEYLYFDLANLKQFDPEFDFPGYTFNSGQIVTTTGVLSRDDFAPYVEWTTHPPELKQPAVFMMGEQGLINYLVLKRHPQGQLSLRRVRFMEVAKGQVKPTGEDMAQRRSHPFVIHWCGVKATSVDQRPLASLLLFFEKFYYSRVRFGFLKRIFRPVLENLEKDTRGLVKKILKPLRN